MENKEMEAACANIAATAKSLESFINKPENYNRYGSWLLEDVVKELEKQVTSIREVQYLYGI